MYCQSVFLAFLEISLIGGVVHQLRDLPSCRQIQPVNEAIYIILFFSVHTFKAKYQIMARHSLEKPSFVFSALIDQRRTILNYSILLSHSP